MKGPSGPGPILVALLLVGGVSVFPSPGEAQSLRYSGGLQYATGSYVFDARSHSFYLSNGLTLATGRFEASASMPLILQNGGLVSAVGDRPVPTGGGQHGAVSERRAGERLRTHRNGGMGPGGMQPPGSSLGFSEAYQVRMGDPMGRLGVEVLSDRGALRSLRATGGVKLPATDLESGVGTGEWDFTLGGSALFARGSTFVMVDASYWWLGDLPDLELRDGVSYGLAVAVPVWDGRGTLMGSASGASRWVDTVDPPLTAGVALGVRLDSGWSLSGGVAAGLTESAPDLSLSMGWSRTLRDGS